MNYVCEQYKKRFDNLKGKLSFKFTFTSLKNEHLSSLHISHFDFSHKIVVISDALLYLDILEVHTPREDGLFLF